MLGLEPRNPEGADLQSAAVAAVPHPHSVFKHLWESSTPQAEMNNKRLLKTCQRKPRRRAYSCHKTYTCGVPGVLPSLLSLASLGRSLRSRIAAKATLPASCVVLLAKPCPSRRSTCYVGICSSPFRRRAALGFMLVMLRKRPLTGAFSDSGASDGNRTHNHRITRPVLYH